MRYQHWPLHPDCPRISAAVQDYHIAAAAAGDVGGVTGGTHAEEGPRHVKTVEHYVTSGKNGI